MPRQGIWDPNPSTFPIQILFQEAAGIFKPPDSSFLAVILVKSCVLFLTHLFLSGDCLIGIVGNWRGGNTHKPHTHTHTQTSHSLGNPCDSHCSYQGRTGRWRWQCCRQKQKKQKKAKHSTSTAFLEVWSSMVQINQLGKWPQMTPWTMFQPPLFQSVHLLPSAFSSLSCLFLPVCLLRTALFHHQLIPLCRNALPYWISQHSNMDRQTHRPVDANSAY